jgi:hypothetical protein
MIIFSLAMSLGTVTFANFVDLLVRRYDLRNSLEHVGNLLKEKHAISAHLPPV